MAVKETEDEFRYFNFKNATYFSAAFFLIYIPSNVNQNTMS